jgi:lysozyme
MTPADIEAAIDFTLALCIRFEGIRLSPYLCPAGVPTIGCGSTHYLDGRSVQLSDPPITREDAIALCRESIRRRYLRATIAMCPAIDTPKRLAALADFAYNLGIGALRASTLRRRVNSGRWQDVPAELRKWVHCGGGRILRGLVLRREAEASLLLLNAPGTQSQQPGLARAA